MFIKKSNRFDPALPMFLHSDGDNGGGGGEEKPHVPAQETAEQRQDRINREVQQKLDAVVTKSGGDLAAALATVIKQSHSFENAKNTAERTVNDLKSQVPDEATRAKWAAYEALGPIEELQTKIQRAQRADELERELKNGAAAGVLGLDPKKPLFKALLGGVEMDIQGEGEAQKVVVLGGEKPVDFGDYAKTRPELEEALPLLSGKPAQTNGTPHLWQPSGEQKTNGFDAKAASQEQSRVLQNV